MTRCYGCYRGVTEGVTGFLSSLAGIIEFVTPLHLSTARFCDARTGKRKRTFPRGSKTLRKSISGVTCNKDGLTPLATKKLPLHRCYTSRAKSESTLASRVPDGKTCKAEV